MSIKISMLHIMRRSTCVTSFKRKGDSRRRQSGTSKRKPEFENGTRRCSKETHKEIILQKSGGKGEEKSRHEYKMFCKDMEIKYSFERGAKISNSDSKESFRQAPRDPPSRTQQPC
jgi:hypothetical protein